MREHQEHFAGQSARAVAMDYWLYFPREYGSGERRWPLVLFLHGAGERGSIERARKHGPARRIAEGHEFPFLLAAPSCPPERWWEPELLEALLQDLCGKHQVDEDRVYCTGLSMGGFGTWATAISYPRRFAAIAPICGGGSPYLAPRIAHLPVWAFHGARDQIVPLFESQRIVEALQALGAHAKLTIYPDAEHDAWTRTYENPELYAWLLSRRRRPG